NSSTDFRPISAGPAAISNLAVAANGEGWTLGSGGRMTRILPSGVAPTPLPSVQLPLDGGGRPAAVAVAPGGDRALAFGGGGSVSLNGGKWAAAPATGLAIRDAGFAGDTPWAIDDSGSLISLAGDKWTMPGSDPSAQQAHAALTQS